MADPQAMMLMTQMSTMRMANAIISGQGVPLAVQTPNNVPSDPVVDDSLRLSGESDEQYKERLTYQMEIAGSNSDYIMASKYQQALGNLK